MQDEFRIGTIMDALTRLPGMGARFTSVEEDGTRIVCWRPLGRLRWRSRATKPPGVRLGTAKTLGRALAAARTAADSLEPAVNPSGRVFRPHPSQHVTSVVRVPMTPVPSEAPSPAAKRLLRFPRMSMHVEVVGTARVLCYPALPRGGYRWSTKEITSSVRGRAGSLDDALAAARSAAEPIHARARIADVIEGAAEQLRQRGDDTLALQLWDAAHDLRGVDDDSR